MAITFIVPAQNPVPVPAGNWLVQLWCGNNSDLIYTQPVKGPGNLLLNFDVSGVCYETLLNLDTLVCMCPAPIILNYNYCNGIDCCCTKQEGI